MKLKYLSMKQRDVDGLQPYQTFGLSFKTSLKPEKQITAKSSLWHRKRSPTSPQSSADFLLICGVKSSRQQLNIESQAGKSLPGWETRNDLQYLMVPVGDGRGLMRWAMLSGMLMVSGEIWGCTGFTGDSGASRFTFFPVDRAVNVILMFVLGNLNVHLRKGKKKKKPQDLQKKWREIKSVCTW